MEACSCGSKGHDVMERETYDELLCETEVQ